jgi:hypothetical protein
LVNPFNTGFPKIEIRESLLYFCIVPGNIFHIIIGIFINTMDLRPNIRIKPKVTLGKRIIEDRAQMPNNHWPFLKYKIATPPFRNNPIKNTR